MNSPVLAFQCHMRPGTVARLGYGRSCRMATAVRTKQEAVQALPLGIAVLCRGCATPVPLVLFVARAIARPSGALPGMRRRRRAPRRLVTQALAQVKGLRRRVECRPRTALQAEAAEPKGLVTQARDRPPGGSALVEMVTRKTVTS